MPELPRDLASLSCATPRAMPLASIDPSVAIGFYCACPADADDLCARLARMARGASGAPLVTVDGGCAGSGACDGGEGDEGGGDSVSRSAHGAGGADAAARRQGAEGHSSSDERNKPERDDDWEML